MADVFCSDCKKSTEVVLDHSTGDTICFECGLVLESHYIDETSEWRTFADDGGDNDPIRVGGPTNPLLADRQLITVISKPKGTTSDFLTTSLQRWSAPDPNRNRTATLVSAFESIDKMAQKLGIVAKIKDRANELFKNLVEDQKAGYRIKNRDATHAACLYLACRQEDIPRTLKEMCTVANGATMKEIGRAAKCIAKHVPSMEMGTGVLHSGSLMMSRFGSYLGFTYQAVKAAQEAVRKIEELDMRRSPISIAAAVIYMVSELSDKKKTLHDVSVATGVAQGTIKECYKDLHPYISRIIPTWFSQRVKA